MRLIRLRQALIVLTGLVVAAVMVVLGLWQLDVYHSQGRAVAEQRASAPPSEIGSVARAGQPVPDGYGRTVIFRGRYLGGPQALVPAEDQPGRYRVVTPLRLDNGDVLPVVRGTATTAAAPPPPSGEQAGAGLLLPSEEAPTGDLPPGQISSVRLPTLAQTWPSPLVSGFVTLSPEDSAAQGLETAPVVLPEGSGRLRNGAYALQWWVFAAFAVGLSLRMARDQELGDVEVGDLTPEEPARAT
ncbi:MAG: Cytochrome oxidase biogenesis protein Surf1, facilitates heme A insertion [uncultured Friedmanniella sp.]|uniref:SURF1-like protein n=1 Tax=uncultured Friedmanniella sp. TaxID=335381 RepID=A0A6J4LL68_9ACTN|nr:MAG: Cytochrome oxidase biogenesis protein Surf1, facilitates heme A insertion [uncultured Friedmanniella sp.]